METTKVAIRESRADLAEYIASSVPVAVTRHGQTAGYFIPTQGQVDVEAVVAEFNTVRKHSSPRNKPLAKVS